MRLEEIALSMSACSRSTLSFWGDWRVNNSCLPRASARSARYHVVRVSNVAGSAANWRKVIMRKSGKHLRSYRELSQPITQDARGSDLSLVTASRMKNETMKQF